MEADIAQLVGNYGVLGLILYFFIKEFFSYLNKNKVADTLKDANNNRKIDTEDVAFRLKEHENQDEKDIALLKQKTDTLENNHLVHQKAIEDWMKRITCVLVKVSNKLDIDTDDIFR